MIIIYNSRHSDTRSMRDVTHVCVRASTALETFISIAIFAIYTFNRKQLKRLQNANYNPFSKNLGYVVWPRSMAHT